MSYFILYCIVAEIRNAIFKWQENYQIIPTKTRLFNVKDFNAIKLVTFQYLLEYCLYNVTDILFLVWIFLVIHISKKLLLFIFLNRHSFEFPETKTSNPNQFYILQEPNKGKLWKKKNLTSNGSCLISEKIELWNKSKCFQFLHSNLN